MMGYWYGSLGWICMIIRLALSLAVIIGLVLLVIWIVKQLSDNSLGRSLNNVAPSALEIAKERYAKGEISREEYQNLLADLGTR